MEILVLTIIFIVSLAALVKGADWFLEGAEKIGLSLGLSPFIVGITIVALGTSFPELFTAVIAMIRGVPEMVVANAIGSNIANILLVVGISAVIGGKLIVKKSLIDLDLPLLAAGTVILFIVIFPFGGGLEGGEVVISQFSSIFLIFAFFVYFTYVLIYDQQRSDEKQLKETEEEDMENVVSIPSRAERREHLIVKEKDVKPKLKLKDISFFLIGIVFLVAGSNYLVDSVVDISALLMIGVGVVSIIAVAVGTALPELLVSIKAVRENKPEVALGNIFGSNVFNSFLVIGVPGLLGDLVLDEKTYTVGVPFLLFATFLFIVSGISRRIHNYEGMFFILLYVLFVVKIFGVV